MSLREEIALIIFENDAYSVDVEDYLPEANKVIKKVLDAAVEAVGANYHIMSKEKETTGVKLHNGVVTMNIEAINKLRSEK